jgi:hypothetical protein
MSNSTAPRKPAHGIPIRICQWLKHLPAAMMALLIAAWGIGTQLSFGLLSPLPAADTYVGIGSGAGSLTLSLNGGFAIRAWLYAEPADWPMSAKSIFGEFQFGRVPAITPASISYLRIPFSWLIIAILPLAVGSLTSFRFRLWHYLAYTTLICLQLAYYLRWQW